MRLFAIIAVGVAGLAFWRRKDVASGAKQASQSAKELASSTREQIGRNGEAPDETVDTLAETTGQASGETVSQTATGADAATVSASEADPDHRSS